MGMQSGSAQPLNVRQEFIDPVKGKTHSMTQPKKRLSEELPEVIFILVDFG